MTQSGRTLSILENIGKPNKYNKKACALHNLIKNVPKNFKFDVATDLLSMKSRESRVTQKEGELKKIIREGHSWHLVQVKPRKKVMSS